MMLPGQELNQQHKRTKNQLSHSAIKSTLKVVNSQNIFTF